MSSVNYLERLASEIRESTPPSALPDGPTDRLFLLYAVIALAKGEETTRADVHNAWAAWMTGLDPSHDSIRPFETLPEEVRSEDDPFVNAIRAVSSRRSVRDPSDDH